MKGKGRKKYQTKTNRKRHFLVVQEGDVFPYKRIMTSAIQKASAAARESMGYVVKAEDGWVVREDANGNKTRIAKIEPAHQSLTLD